jgi:hypothetical protein
VRAELYRSEDPEVVVAVALWRDGRALLEPAEGASDGALEGFASIFRPTPVVVEDPSLRRQGTHGETVLEPGSLEWFRAALLTRVEALGLSVRFVPGVTEGGWDPAAQYRTFEQQVERLAERSS